MDIIHKCGKNKYLVDKFFPFNDNFRHFSNLKYIGKLMLSFWYWLFHHFEMVDKLVIFVNILLNIKSIPTKTWHLDLSILFRKERTLFRFSTPSLQPSSISVTNFENLNREERTGHIYIHTYIHRWKAPWILYSLIQLLTSL